MNTQRMLSLSAARLLRNPSFQSTIRSCPNAHLNANAFAAAASTFSSLSATSRMHLYRQASALFSTNSHSKSLAHHDAHGEHHADHHEHHHHPHPDVYGLGPEYHNFDAIGHADWSDQQGAKQNDPYNFHNQFTETPSWFERGMASLCGGLLFFWLLFRADKDWKTLFLYEMPWGDCSEYTDDEPLLIHFIETKNSPPRTEPKESDSE